MQFLGIGIEEILLILALIVVVVGPRRLPEMAYWLGRGVKTLQRYARVVRDEFSEEFAYLNEEMEAVRSDVQEMRTTVRDVQEELTEVRGEVQEVTSEAVGELGEVRATVEGVAGGAEAAAGPEQTPPAPVPATTNGATAEAGVNGAEPVRGTPGPSYMPKIATVEPREEAPAPEPEAREESGDDAGNAPEKRLVF